MKSAPEVIVVGAGFFGLTIAERIANVSKKKVLVIEKRAEIGGNAHTFFDAKTGIEIHKYGSHLFHTSSLKVWTYINSFSKFNNYKHKVVTYSQDQFYPIPVNLQTMSLIFGKGLSPSGAKAAILQDKKGRNEFLLPLSFESKALDAIGPSIYNKLIKGYTKKQWQTEPSLLPDEIFSRLPIRFNFNDQYFNDTFEGLPINGYSSLFSNMIESPKVEVWTETDYFKTRFYGDTKILTVYTGPIDRYFQYKFGILGWRTLDFEFELVNVDDFQGNSVINYADEEIPFTRIHEFKHLHPERKYRENLSYIAREYSRLANHFDEPYYPINTKTDKNMLAQYRILADSVPNVIFGGRLGRYQYLDMHMAIASAMQTFDNDIKPRIE